MDQYHTSLHIVGIMEKYDHIQTGLEKKFGLYGVVFSGIYNRFGMVSVYMVSFCIKSVCMEGSYHFRKPPYQLQ